MYKPLIIFVQIFLLMKCSKLCLWYHSDHFHIMVNYNKTLKLIICFDINLILWLNHFTFSNVPGMSLNVIFERPNKICNIFHFSSLIIKAWGHCSIFFFSFAWNVNFLILLLMYFRRGLTKKEIWIISLQVHCLNIYKIKLINDISVF